jgi:hypothetical protein
VSNSMSFAWKSFCNVFKNPHLPKPLTIMSNWHDCFSKTQKVK